MPETDLLPALYEKSQLSRIIMINGSFQRSCYTDHFLQRINALNIHLHAVMLMQSHAVCVTQYRLVYNVHCLSATNGLICHEIHLAEHRKLLLSIIPVLVATIILSLHCCGIVLINFQKKTLRLMLAYWWECGEGFEDDISVPYQSDGDGYTITCSIIPLFTVPDTAW